MSMLSNQPTFDSFINEMTVTNIINQDDTLCEYIREMETYIARRGAGITLEEFEVVSDYIEMVKYQQDNHPVVEEQVEQAEFLLAKCEPFIAAMEYELYCK